MNNQPGVSDVLTTVPSTTLTGWRLHFARLAWLVSTSLVIILLGLILRERPRVIWLDPNVADSYQLLFNLMTYRQYGSIVLFIRYMVIGIFILIAVFIFWRKNNDWLAILMSITLVILPYSVFYNFSLADSNYDFPPSLRRLLPAAEGLIFEIGILSLIWLLFTFPDGRFMPRLLRKPFQGLVIFFIAIILNLVFQPKLEGWSASLIEDYGWVFSTSAIGSFVVIGILGQIYRYFRLSSPAQKQQSKWIVFSMLVNLGIGILSIFGLGSSLRFETAAVFGLLVILGGPVVVLLIPLSLAFSVLRFRLWEIDLIIRRTLVYSLLTGTVSVLYFSSVALLQGTLTANRAPQTTNSEAVSTEPSAVVIVGTTLAIAALFTPLRNRIQNTIDRRFYRQKYDAEQALADFAAAARNETDLVQLSNGLTAAVQETLQPEKVNLWLTQ